MSSNNLEIIGQGVTSKVYKINLSNGQQFAYKEYNNLDIVSFIRETSILSSSRHPNIVKIQSADNTFDSEKIGFLMEYAQWNLESWLNFNRITPSSLKYIAFSLFSALDYLHSNKIIHRDIKPENILLLDDGTVKLADFSLAVYHCGQDLEKEVQSLDYRAPEVLDGKPYNSAIDIWSIGLILYRLCTSTSLFSEYTLSNLRAFQNSTCSHQPVITLFNNPLLADIINRCLELDPVKRITAAEALQSPYFRGWKKELPIPISPTDNGILKEDLTYLENIVPNPEVQKLAKYILAKWTDRRKKVVTGEIYVCCAIANMLCYNIIPVEPQPQIFNVVLEKICNILNNRLLPL